uniref:Uncharacterized protein n=1 Tax=Pyxicephalus adspersus TaxID=30357 RepID=A0AAV3B189_PYXAD|nr:TPA: hypothetical protein GDO54_006413 [Pyxicephalus adspersus]
MYAMIQSPTHANAFRLPVISYQVQCSASERFGTSGWPKFCEMQKKKKNKPQRERELLYNVHEVDLHVDSLCEGTLQNNVEILKSLQHSDQRIHHHVVP